MYISQWFTVKNAPSQHVINFYGVSEFTIVSIKLLIILSVFVLGPLTALSAAADWQGRVAYVKGGGDILTISTNDNRNIEIRLLGIDCPEQGQPFAGEAEELVKRLLQANGYNITVLEETRESDGRVLATVVLHDGTTLNDRLLVAGLAWYYEQNCNDAITCNGLRRLESTARDLRRGLWSQEQPVPPWQWTNTRQ
jgi:endonuclease YncB( thermonuclease family)